MMARPLSAVHFKSQPRVPVSAMAPAVKLASLMAESCCKGLSQFAVTSWRVALDRIEETGFPPADAYARTVRFESAGGSLTIHLTLDRPAISALIEAMMGGNGSEAPFDMGERPLSKIESGILDVVCGTLAVEMAQALGRQFGRPFSHFESDETLSPADALEQASFHFLVNVFGHSGEIRLSMARSELAQQIKAAVPEGEGLQDVAARQQMQRQIGRSDVGLTVTLGSETLLVEDITNLRPGKMIELSSTVMTPVTLWSGGVAAFEGRLARNGDRFAVTITSAFT